MRGFVLDENLPRRIRFVPRLPLIHVSDLGQSLTDSSLWEYARVNEYVIVTKDTDFSHRAVISSPPPWVVHLRIGNVRRKEFHLFLERVWPTVESFLPAHKLVNVFFDRIEGIK